jgi:hypothetical protein
MYAGRAQNVISIFDLRTLYFVLRDRAIGSKHKEQSTKY